MWKIIKHLHQVVLISDTTRNIFFVAEGVFCIMKHKIASFCDCKLLLLPFQLQKFREGILKVAASFVDFVMQCVVAIR